MGQHFAAPLMWTNSSPGDTSRAGAGVLATCGKPPIDPRSGGGAAHAHIDTGALHLRARRGGQGSPVPPGSRSSSGPAIRGRTAALVEAAAQRREMPRQLRRCRRSGAASAARRRDPSTDVIGDDRRWRPNRAVSRRDGRSGAAHRRRRRAGARVARHPRHRRRQDARAGARPARSRSISKARSSPAPPRPPASRSWCCARWPTPRPANCRRRR